MNPEKSISLFLESVSQQSTNADIDEEFVDFCVKLLATISETMGESVYVIDPDKNCIRYVSPGGIFPYGYSSEEKQRAEYHHREETHPDDLPMLTDTRRAVNQFLDHPDIPLDDLSYIAFNFRVQSHKKHLMMCHKMTPIVINGRVRLLFCTVTDSAYKISGNLTAYHKTGHECSRYSYKSKRWLRESMITLTPKEKDILELSRTGDR